MRHNIINKILLFLISVTWATAPILADKLYCKPFSIKAGETETLILVLENTKKYTGFQMDVKTSEGLSIDALKGIGVRERSQDGLTQSGDYIEDGWMRIVSYSVTHTPFKGNDGDFMFIPITASEDFTSGEINIKNIIFSDESDHDVRFQDISCKIEAPAIQVTEINIVPESIEIKIGDKYTLKATVLPENATDNSIEWSSSNPNIVKVNETGIVEGLGIGEATITAKATNGIYGTAKISVKSNVIEVSSITLDKTAYTGKEGTTIQLTATVLPDNATDKSVTWSSSDSKIITVSENGLVSLIGMGKANVTATADNINATCEIIVTAPDPTDIKVIPSSIELKTGDTSQLKTEFTPSYAESNLTWRSSKTSVATVSDSGLVTAIAKGECVVTVSSVNNPSVYAECKITVTDQTIVKTISLNVESAEIYYGMFETCQLTATITPESEGKEEITWISSDESVATVDKNGLVTPVSEGKCVVTARLESDPTVYAECKVTIINAYYIMLNSSDVELKINETFQLQAYRFAVEYTGKYSWISSNENIATVNSDGLIKAIGPGECIIRVFVPQIPNIYAECKVTVTNSLIIENITLNKESVELENEETVQLTATITPDIEGYNGVIWISSNENIATVNENGLVIAVSKGECVITAISQIDSSVYAECKVTVTETIVIERITMNIESVNMETEETIQLTATITPNIEGYNGIVWKSSNDKVASVDSKGLVIALTLGESTITATSEFDSSIYAECQVSVSKESGIEAIPEDAQNLSVYTLHGILIFKNVNTSALNDLPKGLYLIKTQDGKTYKIVK